jgi:hypothetical protein
MGMVGPSYERGSLAFVSVNPAGGKPESRSTTTDTVLYRAIEDLRDAKDSAAQLFAFEQLVELFMASMPTWTIWRQYIKPILEALSKSLAEVAYLYLVPFRTRGDAGSSMSKQFTLAGYSKHLCRQLDLLDPGLIIAVDRPSEHFTRSWLTEPGHKCEVFYYTRKRDEHTARAHLLADLRARYGVR